MKRIFVFLSLLFIPTFVWADMVGFSGDARRYVTNVEKGQYPYNSVVRITNKDGSATGTFVSNDVILTCKNVVDDIGLENDINYYTPDGTSHTGFVAKYPDGNNKTKDYALIAAQGGFSGDVSLSDVSKQSNNLMIIGYDNLKPLSDDELRIVKHLYGMWLSENEDLTAKNSRKAMQDVDTRLKNDYACSSTRSTNCVRCSNRSGYCIFDDSVNMKVRQGCKINYIGDQIYTNCPLTPGAIGAAAIDADTKQIVGVLCEIRRPQIGQEKEALTLGTKPEVYNQDMMVMIGYMQSDDEE